MTAKKKASVKAWKLAHRAELAEYQRTYCQNHRDMVKALRAYFGLNYADVRRIVNEWRLKVSP